MFYEKVGWCVKRWRIPVGKNTNYYTPGMHFKAIFYSKNIHNSVKNNCIGKKSNFNQSINQKFNLSTDQSINQSTNQPTNQSINQSINQSTNQSINQSINQLDLYCAFPKLA